MSLIDLQGKKLYVGDQTIKRVYLGDDRLYNLPGPPVTPTLSNYLFNVGVAYDFTHGNIDQYYLSTKGGFTGLFNHNSITSYATYAEQVSTIAFNSGSNSYSSWGSITFSADSGSGTFYRKDGRYEGYTDLSYENNGPSNRRIRWGIKRGRNRVSYSYYTIPSDFKHITVDVGTNHTTTTYSNKLYVNGVEVLTNSQDSIADNTSSPFSFYRLSGNKIYDIKAMYGNSLNTQLSASNVAESYANIEERLNR